MGGFTGAAALIASAGFMEMPKAFAQSATPSVSDVLNFALNLEYLEANFYYFAATGNTIPTSSSGTPTGPVTGTSAELTAAVQANPTVLALATALYHDELNHIAVLQQTITSLGAESPITQPALNYAANGTVTTVAQFLAAARQFTALGNSAYAGAAVDLVSNTTVLTAAAQILGAEGQHLGAVNYQCITENVTASFSTYTGTPSPYLDPMDQPPNPTQYFTVFLSGAEAGFSPARTTSQDLGVVYGASTPSAYAPTGITSGGFFPQGVNGNVKST